MSSKESTKRISRETREHSGDSEQHAKEQREPCLPQLKLTLRLTLSLKELTSTPALQGQGLKSFAQTCSREHWSPLRRQCEMLKWTSLLSMTLFLLEVQQGFQRFKSCCRTFSMERN